MALDGQRFCLKWNDFRSSVTAVFEDLRQDGELVDITLCCEGKKVKAHRMMLSACSPYFRDVLKENPSQHPVFFLKDTTFADLQAVIQFVYNGEVNVTQAQLSSFLKTAEMLQVRGLTGDDEKDSAPPPATRPPPQPPAPPPQHRPAPLSRPPPPMMTPSPAARPLPSSGHKRPMPSPAPSPAKRPAPRLDDQYIESVTLSDSPPPPQLQPAAAAGAPASPGRRRRLSAGSSSGGGGGPATPLGSEPSADATAASPAGDSSSHSLPAPQFPPMSEPAPAAAADQPALHDQLKVEKVEDVDEGDESLEAALGSMGEYEGGYAEHDQGMMFAGADLGQGGGMGMQPRTSDGGASGGGNWQSGLCHQCSICEKRYLRRGDLTSHMKSHTGETTCHVCGRIFSNKTNLKVHIMTQHRP